MWGSSPASSLQHNSGSSTCARCTTEASCQALHTQLIIHTAANAHAHIDMHVLSGTKLGRRLSALSRSPDNCTYMLAMNTVWCTSGFKLLKVQSRWDHMHATFPTHHAWSGCQPHRGMPHETAVPQTDTLLACKTSTAAGHTGEMLQAR